MHALLHLVDGLTAIGQQHTYFRNLTMEYKVLQNKLLIQLMASHILMYVGPLIVRSMWIEIDICLSQMADPFQLG